MRASAKVLSLALGVLGSLALLDSAAASQFWADIVITNALGQAPPAIGKLYVGAGIVRIESSNFPKGWFLVDVNAGTAFFVMPKPGLFMAARQSSRLTQILVPVDPNDPCAAWQAMAKVAGAAEHGAEWHCERLGVDAVGGISAVKYRATSPGGETDYAWVDRKLEFPIKFQFADGTGIMLDAIGEAPQPAALFAIPSRFRRFDPVQLIERIKKSDVWVDPPQQSAGDERDQPAAR